MKIPYKFYNTKKAGESHPVAENGGELKRLLEELPDDLPLDSGFEIGMTLVVFNHGCSDMALSFEDPDWN